VKGLRLGLLALALLVLGGGAYVMRARRGPSRPMLASFSTPEVVRAPEKVRIRVQVLNTTRTRGLARRATRLLRDRGFDVVEMGTTGPALDTTMVLDRSGHPEWAATVAKVMTPARAEARPDSSRYLDVTVLVGRTWRPAAEPLDP
jgi:hypothetical protein